MSQDVPGCVDGGIRERAHLLTSDGGGLGVGGGSWERARRGGGGGADGESRKCVTVVVVLPGHTPRVLVHYLPL